MTGAGKQWSFIQGLMGRPLLLLLVVGACVFLVAVPKFPDVKLSAQLESAKSGRSEICDNPQTQDLAIDHRRRLAKQIASVQRELQRIAGREAVVDAKWPLRLAAVAAELDPRMALEAESANWDHSARLPGIGPAPLLPDRKRHVCPEIYDSSDGAPYWTDNMRPEKCTYVPDFRDVVTGLLPAYHWRPGTANFVVRKIRKLYDFPVIVIISQEDKIDSDIDNVTVIKHTKTDNEAETVNNAVKLIKTPYTFMGFSLTHFDRHSSLERLVRILDELESVKVVGGAARDLTGQWNHGCLQLSMVYYQAYYVKGYYYSKYECMYCDDILSSFVTHTSLLAGIPLTTSVRGSALYRDWFAKVREKGYLVMLCPDVMFYVEKHVTLSRDDWMMVGKQWALEKIHSYDKTVYNFTCEEVGITCDNPLDIIHSYLLPPCCTATMEKYSVSIAEYGNKNNLDYELHAGSVLGAVKMGSYLPWDYDMDFYVHCKDYDQWIEIDKLFKKEKCHNAVNTPGVYFTINCPYFFLELYCHDKLSGELELPRVYKNISTTIRYAGQDFKVIANPGHYCRNKMGFDNLKHAAHWRTLKISSTGKAKGGYDNPGSWNPCKNPKHHSCLDHFPGDGNLPFLEPFLLL